MSIAARSVMGRILDEVREGPGIKSLGDRADWRGDDAVVHVRETPDTYRPPFATPLHFWGYALRDLLRGFGREDAFYALACNSLCLSVEGAALEAALGDVVGRAGVPLGVNFKGYSKGYRMIDQPVFASWVAEGEEGFVAVFWLQPSWLAVAEHVPRDDFVPGS